MPIPLKLRIVEQSRVFEYDLPARLELGRQAPLANSNALEPGPFSLVSQADGSLINYTAGFFELHPEHSHWH